MVGQNTHRKASIQKPKWVVLLYNYTIIQLYNYENNQIP